MEGMSHVLRRVKAMGGLTHWLPVHEKQSAEHYRLQEIHLKPSSGQVAQENDPSHFIDQRRRPLTGGGVEFIPALIELSRSTCPAQYESLGKSADSLPGRLGLN